MVPTFPADAYASKRVLVTGHTGFKGGWLCVWLRELGAEVCGYSLDPPSEPNFFHAAGLSSHLRHEHGDILDLDRLRIVCRDFRPHALFHLAAQPLVRESYRDPLRTLETNVLGTATVLEAVRTTPSLRAVVNVTSDKCYENREWVWGYRESDRLGGRDPYSASKACAELVHAAYRDSFFGPFFEPDAGADRPALATVRAGNVIGGGDWGLDRLVPDCVRACSSGTEVVIRYPQALRPWQHVLDPLAGYLHLGGLLLQEDRDRAARHAGPWNFGPDNADPWSVQRVADAIVSLWRDGAVGLEGAPQPHEASLLQLDCSKARAQLGWRPRLDVGAALDWTVEWYKAFYEGADPDRLHDLTRDQIRRYAALA